jgi:hypothetical protein
VDLQLATVALRQRREQRLIARQRGRQLGAVSVGSVGLFVHGVRMTGARPENHRSIDGGGRA